MLVLKMFVSCIVLCYVCLFVVYMLVFSCLFVVYRSHSARVQKSSHENYAPGNVPVVDSFRRRPGIRAPTAQQQAPPTRQILVE